MNVRAKRDFWTFVAYAKSFSESALEVTAPIPAVHAWPAHYTRARTRVHRLYLSSFFFFFFLSLPLPLRQNSLYPLYTRRAHNADRKLWRRARPSPLALSPFSSLFSPDALDASLPAARRYRIVNIEPNASGASRHNGDMSFSDASDERRLPSRYLVPTRRGRWRYVLASRSAWFGSCRKLPSRSELLCTW